MKLLLALSLVGLAVAGNFYDSKYENFNIDELLNNPRLFNSYAHCFLDLGKCTPEGTEIKGWISEGITSSCGRCTEKQRALVAKCITVMKTKYAKHYESLMAKYNPKGKYNRELEIFLSKYSG